MKRKTNYSLNKQDKEIVEVFTELGMPKNLAKTLIYISNVDECRSKDIEKGVNLLQPQVSVAIQELRKKGWVKKYEIKKKRKGRPVHRYSLNRSLSNIVDSFQKEKTEEVKTIQKNLTDLENIINSV